MSEIVVKNLTKEYGEVKALDNVSLSFEGNKIYALLGKNGAGKSTLLSAITNRVFATSGEVFIDGEKSLENDKSQNNVFCMSESGDYPKDLKVKDAFSWAKLYYPSFDKDYAFSLCEKFMLNTKKKIGQLSTGYSSIYKLILTLASNTPVCIFDEPALGLDAAMRDLFYTELIRYYGENPKIIIISTHLIEEIAKIVEHVVILKNGKIIANDNIDNFLSSGYKVSGEAKSVDEFVADKKVLKIEELGRLKTVSIFGELSTVDKTKANMMDLELSNMGLQEMFINMTQGDVL